MFFSRNSKPSCIGACTNPCVAGKDGDNRLSIAVQRRITSLTGRQEPATGRLPTDGSPVLISSTNSSCQRRAATLGPTLRRFNRYREALPYARAASDMNTLGDDPKPPKTDEPKQPKGPCLTRLPVGASALCEALHLPAGSIKDEDLRNDVTGFRAAMYRDEGSGKVILVARDTQPTSLVDWQTNTRNGDGKYTDQYAAMRELSRRLAKKGVAFDVAGYSKGGGLAQEAALYNPAAKAFVFNSSGIPDVSVGRNGNVDLHSLEQRTSAFSAQDDFLTFMNDTTDSDHQIENVEFLRRELEGKNRMLINPMKIDHRSPVQPNPKQDGSFDDDLAAYLKELDQKLASMKADRAAGRPVKAFPPVRAIFHETLPGKTLNSGANGPNLGKLAQHQMKNVLEPMEAAASQDQKALNDFLEHCG